MPPKRSKIAVGPRQVVDQHHGARAVGAGIEAERRPLPEHAQIAGILGVERAVAVAQAADEGAAGFLAQHIAVGQAPLAARLSRRSWRARARRRRRSDGRHRRFRPAESGCRPRRRLLPRRTGRRPRRSAARPAPVCATHGVMPNPANNDPAKMQGNDGEPAARIHGEFPLNPLLTRIDLALGETDPNQSHHSPKL